MTPPRCRGPRASFVLGFFVDAFLQWLGGFCLDRQRVTGWAYQDLRIVNKCRLHGTATVLTPLVCRRIRFEILRGERKMIKLEQQLSSADVRAMRDRKLPAVSVDDEHAYWPFEGEYWKDELGAYTFLISNRCLVAKP